MTTALKTLVSKKKHRFVKDGYNLDLTYISGESFYIYFLIQRQRILMDFTL